MVKGEHAGSCGRCYRHAASVAVPVDEPESARLQTVGRLESELRVSSLRLAVPAAGRTNARAAPAGHRERPRLDRHRRRPRRHPHQGRPRPHYDIDIYRDVHTIAGAPKPPLNLLDALREYEKDESLQAAMGADFATAYLSPKRQKLDRLLQSLHGSGARDDAGHLNVPSRYKSPARLASPKPFGMSPIEQPSRSLHGKACGGRRSGAPFEDCR